MPQDVKLPDGTLMTREEFDKLDAIRQNQIQSGKMPQLKTPQLSLNPGNIPIGAQGYHESMGDFFKDMGNRIMAGGMGAALGGLRSGPVGAFMGGASMGLFPPKNATEYGIDAASLLSSGLASEFGEPLVQAATENPFGRAAIRGTLGLAQEKLIDDPIRKTFNQEQGNMKTTAINTLLPMLGGNIADRALTSAPAKVNAARRSIQANISQMTGQEGDAVNAAKLAAQAGSKPAQEAFDTAQKAAKSVPEARVLQQQAQQAKQQGQQMATSSIKNLNSQRDKLMTTPMYSDDESQALRAAYLQQNAQARSRYEGLAQGLPSADPHKQVIQALQKQKQQVLSQIGQGNPYLTDDQIRLQASGIDDQITQHVAASFKQELDNLRQVSGQNAQNMFDPKNPGTAGVQKALDSATQQANDNPIENVYLKNLVAAPPNIKGTPAGTPLRSPSPDSFITNIINLDDRHVQELYKVLGKQPDGDKLISNVKDAVMNKFFAMAYDPQTQQLSNAQALLKGDGPFNQGKLEAIFGDGVEGQQRTQQFGQLISDLNSLEKSQALAAPDSAGTKLMHFGLFSTPTGLAYYAGMHAGGPKVGAMAGAAVGVPTVGYKLYNSLMNTVLENPSAAKALHSWAGGGGGADALQYSPVLASLFSDKAPGVSTKPLGDNPALPTAPQGQQGGGQGQQGPPQGQGPGPSTPPGGQQSGGSGGSGGGGAMNGPLGPLGVWPGSQPPPSAPQGAPQGGPPKPPGQ